MVLYKHSLHLLYNVHGTVNTEIITGACKIHTRRRNTIDEAASASETKRNTRKYMEHPQRGIWAYRINTPRFQHKLHV